jgi:hypothetical protein
MPNPFRVAPFFVDSIPGLSLRSNPGVELANAFGVLSKDFGVLSKDFGVLTKRKATHFW